MSKREVESDTDYVVESFIGPSPTPPLQESPQGERLAYQIEEVSPTGATSIADPLITGAEKDEGEIVVFQREDGAFVNQVCILWFLIVPMCCLRTVKGACFFGINFPVFG